MSIFIISDMLNTRSANTVYHGTDSIFFLRSYNLLPNELKINDILQASKLK